MTTPMNTAANHENFNEGFIFYHAFDQDDRQHADRSSAEERLHQVSIVP